MVLHLSRGGYCPKENRFVRRLVEAYPDFRVAHTRIVLISTDNQLDTNEFRDTQAAEFPFLSDPDRVVQQDLDIQEYTDPVHDPMIPHTFVLEPGLRIHSMYIGLLVLGAPHHRGASRGPARRDEEDRPDFDPTATGCARHGRAGTRGVPGGAVRRRADSLHGGRAGWRRSASSAAYSRLERWPGG